MLHKIGGVFEGSGPGEKDGLKVNDPPTCDVEDEVNPHSRKANMAAANMITPATEPRIYRTF